jgi:protein O-GlcNAc transferase
MNRHQRRAAAKLGGMKGNSSAAVPPDIAALFGAAVTHHLSGRLAEAEAQCRCVLEAAPRHADATHLLGVIALQAGRHDLAVELIRRATQLNGSNPNYFSDLGNVCFALGDLDAAVAACREVIRLAPDDAGGHCNLGTALSHLGRLDEAIAAYGVALRIKPDHARAPGNLGVALYHQGKHDAAVAAYRAALRINPDDANVHCNLGAALYHQGKLTEAVAAYRAALRVKPDYAKAICNLGTALADQGKRDEAVAAYREAILLKPDYAEAGSNLLLCLNYDERCSNAELFDEHRAWAHRHGHAAPLPVTYANEPSTEKRLKVGYVSPDFRGHSVAFFLEPLLKHHNRKEIELFCYAEVNWPDAVTERFKALADRWRVTVGMSDTALAERIRHDAIDILVDLAGHMAKNRLPVFSRKPSPVQVTWLGYPNTTGLETVDYRLVDAVTDPEGEADAWASETPVRLPGGFLCYGAPGGVPAPGPPPCLTTGSITFGSFNNPTKLSGATLDAWATLLARLPVARLVLKGRPFADATVQGSLLQALTARGVAAKRIELLSWLPDGAAHLALYDRIDIALDPFPYNGTTTTCEALWMGVPVVTLRGDRHAGRVGATLLTQVGLTDLVAGSAAEYVGIAVTLAGNSARLKDLRSTLRSRMAASPLCDAPAFARKIESAYRAMWRLWVANNKDTKNPAFAPSPGSSA